MAESRGQRRTSARGDEAEIGWLREQILALADADFVRPEDERALLAALDAALRELSAGDVPAARAGIERFIAASQGLIEAGMLARQGGQPPLAAACTLLAALGD